MNAFHSVGDGGRLTDDDNDPCRVPDLANEQIPILMRYPLNELLS